MAIVDTTQPTPAPAPDEDYASSEDEDFNPTTGDHGDEDVSSSSDEDEDATIKSKAPKPKKRKADEQSDLDSGDEVTIEESRRKKKRKARNGEDEDSGGEGGLVKTRAQRKAEKQERQEYRRAHRGEVTVDVESLWAKLNSTSVGRRAPISVPIQDVDAVPNGQTEQTNGHAPEGQTDGLNSTVAGPDEEMVTIQHTYEFAGQKVSEERKVHRDSAEAKLYFSSHDKDSAKRASVSAAPQRTVNGIQLRRPLKRPSMYEPNPTGEVKGLPADRQRLRTPSRADVLAQQARQEEERQAAIKQGKAVKINTVQKSAIDWAAHVDKEGLKDELAEYGRSKQGYMGRMDFLRDVEGRREVAERNARLQQS